MAKENILYSTGNSIYALWWPEQEGIPKGRGYMCTCGWFALLYSRNYHNILKQLHSNKNTFKKKKKRERIYGKSWGRGGPAGCVWERDVLGWRIAHAVSVWRGLGVSKGQKQGAESRGERSGHRDWVVGGARSRGLSLLGSYKEACVIGVW